MRVAHLAAAPGLVGVLAVLPAGALVGDVAAQLAHGLERAQRELGPIVAEARLPAPGQTSGEGYEGEGFVVLRHPDTGVVERGLERLVQLVRVELG